MSLATSERFESLLQGCARALSGSPALALTFGVEERRFSPQSGRLTRRPPQMSPRQRSVLRGQADLAGLYRRLHDPRLPAAANDAATATILEEAEQARIALIGARRFVGVAANLAAMLDERYVQAERIVAAEDTAERRSLALAALLLEALGPALLGRRYWLVETRRQQMMPVVQAHAALLQAALGDQAAFGRIVLAIAATLPALPRPDVEPPRNGIARPHPKGEENAGGIEEEVRSTGEAAGLKVVTEEATGSEPLFGQAERTDVPNLETDAAPRTMREDDGTAQPVRRTTTDGEPPPDSYRVFTRAFDETVSARTLLTRLAPPRDQPAPDPEIVDLRRVIARLAARLERRLLASRMGGWERDLEDGVLDPKRLSRAITSPASRQYFMQSRPELLRDTAVTLLLDTSASMRGRPLRIVALCVEILARVLVRVGVRVEVLGFTTRSWRGGRAREAWLAAGSPPGPGRLSELLHIVFKPAQASVRRLAGDLRLLTMRELPKENIDGEALEWACRRLLRQGEQRRILMMISDGAPSDEGTLAVSNSTGNLLEAHLRRVAAEIDRAGQVELLAIGIGYDVAKLYPSAIRINDASELSEVLMTQLYHRLGERRSHRRA